jgi:hypothetical protein
VANHNKAKVLAPKAARLYTGKRKLSIEDTAKELGVAYRTARKALVLAGVELRDPSERLIGRTRPDVWANA